MPSRPSRGSVGAPSRSSSGRRSCRCLHARRRPRRRQWRRRPALGQPRAPRPRHERPSGRRGWHGQPWGKPLTRTREYLEIVRTIRREALAGAPRRALRHPLQRRRRHRPGQAAEAIVHPPRADVLIYLAAIGSKNVALAEIADGWLPIFAGTLRRDPSPDARRGVRAPRRQAGGAGTSPRTSRWSSRTTSRRDATSSSARALRRRHGREGPELLHASRSATATPRRRRRSRISTSPGRRTRRSLPSRTPSSTRSPSSGTGPGSRTASLPSASGVTTLVLQARQPEALRLLADVV